MKNEQVVPDYKIMLETSVTLLALIASGWLLIKLISACFWLPDFLKKWSLEENNSEADQLTMKEEMKQTEKNDGIMNIDNSSSDIENGEEKSQQAEGENKKDK